LNRDRLTSVPVPFRETLRSLRVDEATGGNVVTMLAVAAMVTWTVWALVARIPLYATAETAQLETQQTTFHIAAPVDGTIVRSDLELGRVVPKGHVLVELDATAERLALAQGRARVASVQNDIASLERELLAEDRAREADDIERRIAVDEALAATAEARVQVEIARRRAADLSTLLQKGLVSRADADLASQEAAAKRERLNAVDLSRQRLVQARETAAAGARAKRADFDVRLTRLRGDLILAERSVGPLEHEVARRRLVAPAGGRIGELRNVHPGTFVEAGQRLGTLVPDGVLRIVAAVSGDAMVRVRPGQPARFRFDGFPALTHGALAATVSQVGTETSNGAIEVILTPSRDAGIAFPIQHGAPGRVDIEVERRSPAEILLRRIGSLVERGRTSQ
jgi:multidrug resistance efflux pump